MTTTQTQTTTEQAVVEIPAGWGICPVCNGAKKVTRDGRTDDCTNCGAQEMFGRATGIVPLRRDGTPCAHEYVYKNLGRCYHGYTCQHCGHNYCIDSGD